MHKQPLLGFHACRALELLRVVEENICEVQAAPANASSSTAYITETDVVAAYPDLFEGAGLPKATFTWRRTTPFCRYRCLSADYQFATMEANGIIAPVTEASSWVSVRFLLDCGATVNLLPTSFVRSIGRMDDVRRPLRRRQLYACSTNQSFKRAA